LTKEDYTADKLVKDTGIPMGRIYEFLNDLLEIKLIEKKPGYPAIYSIGNFNDRLIDFLNHQKDLSTTKETKLMALIKEEKEDMRIIQNPEEFNLLNIDLQKEHKTIKNILRHELVPTIFYSENEDEFKLIRTYLGKKRGTLAHKEIDMSRLMAFRATKEAYQSGKKRVYIMEKISVDLNLKLLEQRLGKEKFVEYVKNTIKRLDKYPNVGVNLVDEFLPIQIRICDDYKVVLAILHMGRSMGIIIRSKNVTKFYESFFEELLSRSVPLKTYLKEYLK
jgi:hypothetical protein